MKFKKEIANLPALRSTVSPPRPSKEEHDWKNFVDTLRDLVMANVERCYCEVDFDYEQGWTATATNDGPRWVVTARHSVEITDGVFIKSHFSVNLHPEAGYDTILAAVNDCCAIASKKGRDVLLAVRAAEKAVAA
jgi:hypothetical protein